MRIKKKNGHTTITITKWDYLMRWVAHIFGKCDAWCGYCYDAATKDLGKNK